ncbi:MAG: hypothetical protein US69_C0007G0066 [candidate division TM6 bacterium GW2011_GWF2_38_10]|nr:MAG: hypothetical protein US69_C0007G0066 [candidate division TM6 bacterium GW2011_GWF2_38_10]
MHPQNLGGDMRMFLMGVAVVCMVIPLDAHIKKEQGFFYTYVNHLVQEKKHKDVPAYEPLVGSKDPSKVFIIEAQRHFDKMVIAQSFQRPVVVKLYAPQSIDCIKVLPIFQEVAKALYPHIACAAIDIITHNQLFVQLMTLSRVDSVALPLFMFFKDGQLYAPLHDPVLMVQGYVTKDNLIDHIRRKFLLP